MPDLSEKDLQKLAGKRYFKLENAQDAANRLNQDYAYFLGLLSFEFVMTGITNVPIDDIEDPQALGKADVEREKLHRAEINSLRVAAENSQIPSSPGTLYRAYRIELMPKGTLLKTSEGRSIFH